MAVMMITVIAVKMVTMMTARMVYINMVNYNDGKHDGFIKVSYFTLTSCVKIGVSGLSKIPSNCSSVTSLLTIWEE